MTDALNVGSDNVWPPEKRLAQVIKIEHAFCTEKSMQRGSYMNAQNGSALAASAQGVI